VHLFIVLTFLYTMVSTKLRHMFIGPVNIFFKTIGAGYEGGSRLAPVADFENEDHQHIVFEPHDDADVADAIAPGTGEVGLQRLTDGTRIIERADAVIEEAQNPGAITAAELAEVLLGTRSELDRPSHLRIGLQIVRVLPRHLFERNALAHIGANAFLGDVRVLEVLDMLEDGLAGVETLRPASLLGESVEAGFDFRRQAKGKHWVLLRDIHV